MNAGYIGYYDSDIISIKKEEINDYDTKLTASLFKIYDDKIIIKRYSKDGLFKKYKIKLKNQ